MKTPWLPRESLTTLLPNGRTLSYAEYGSPSGYPLLFFHGFPSSRLEAYPLDRLGMRKNIRIFSIDRPGFGNSTPQPGRTILDWPADVEGFAKEIGLNKFAILGASGGAPYALACAKVLPRDVATSVGFFAGAPPWGMGAEKVSIYRRVMAWMSRRTPAVLSVILDASVGTLKWLTSTGPVMRWIDQLLIKLKDANNKKQKPDGEDDFGLGADGEMSITESRQRLLGLLYGGFAQGSTACVEETRLLSEPDWGFRFQDVEAPVTIWHGTKDWNAPIDLIRDMARLLPNATLHELHDDTHYTMAKHLSQALDDLLSQASKIK